MTPYQHRFGFSWYLCPVTLFKQSEWLLINVEFGVCQLVKKPNATALAVEEAAITAIDHHLPVDRDEDNVSVSYRPNDVTWHTATKIPEHVGMRYLQAQQLLGKCIDRFDPEEAMDRLNTKALTLGGCTFAPVEGLEGLLLELANDFRHYIETTPWWKLQWHMWTRRAAWIERKLA